MMLHPPSGKGYGIFVLLIW